MAHIGFKEWIVILIVILLLFGAKKIPELAKGLGKGLREFKKAIKESEIEEVKADVESIIKDETEADDK
jgi:sec-independent protein translocase protein TatA